MKPTHLIIDEGYGFTEYAGTALSDRCFDLPDDIDESIETIEFKGHSYDLKKYRELSDQYCSIDRDWSDPNIVNEFVELVVKESQIKLGGIL